MRERSNVKERARQTANEKINGNERSDIGLFKFPPSEFSGLADITACR